MRKFYCRNPDCSGKVFTERLPDLAEPWARMTTRLKEQITSIGLATSGKAGVRLGDRLGIETSRNTTLRRIMDVPQDPRASVVYLGIDDFGATRKVACVAVRTLERRRILPGVLPPVPYQTESSASGTM